MRLENSLERARTAVREQTKHAEARLSRLIRAARDHARDRRTAGVALDEIARVRLYRLRGHASLAAFLRAELGISRTTAHRLRAEATARSAPRSPERREAEAAATELRRALRRLDVRGPRVTITSWRGQPSVQLVLRPSELGRLRLERRRRT